MVVELSLGDFLGCLHNQRGALRIEQTEIMIGLRGRPFDKAEGANEWPRKPVTAHRKIQDSAVSRGAMKRGCRQGHLAHRIFFHPPRLLGHAERSAPTPTNPETFRRCAARRPRYCSGGVL